MQEYVLKGHPTNTYKAGSVFGLDSVLYYEKRENNVVAMSDCELWCFDKRGFYKVYYSL
jgi:CRP-like cAMP-binding protein